MEDADYSERMEVYTGHFRSFQQQSGPADEDGA